MWGWGRADRTVIPASGRVASNAPCMAVANPDGDSVAGAEAGGGGAPGVDDEPQFPGCRGAVDHRQAEAAAVIARPGGMGAAGWRWRW